MKGIQNNIDEGFDRWLSLDLSAAITIYQKCSKPKQLKSVQ
jgi:hypothetical protein